MQLCEFIFSKNGKYRLFRHLTFWLAWIAFSSFVQLTPAAPENAPLKLLVANLILKAIFRLPFQLIFCYCIVYVLVPKFISGKKFRQFAWYVLLSAFLLYWLTYFFLTPLFSVLNTRLWGRPLSPFIRYFFSFYSNVNFTGPIPACAFMLIIKYYKNWYLKQSESQTLIRENSRAELQLLRAQVHPHFLFNTLNNIYSYTLANHPYAADLVDKLAGMIDYMCNEGNKSLVPIGKEIRLMNDYIALEKIRYGDRLKMKVDIQGELENKFIAPLLMIPFVENCFKHGASRMISNQWIEMSIYVNENQLRLSLINNKPDEQGIFDKRKGIGLMNVQKRLQLLYPSSHILKFESTNSTYSVYFQLELSEKGSLPEDVSTEPGRVSYA